MTCDGPFGFLLYKQLASSCGTNANFANYANDGTVSPTSPLVLPHVLRLCHATEGVL